MRLAAGCARTHGTLTTIYESAHRSRPPRQQSASAARPQSDPERPASLLPDIEIITKSDRSHASLFANSFDGLHWISRNIARPLCASMILFDPRFVNEFRKSANDSGLIVDVVLIK